MYMNEKLYTEIQKTQLGRVWSMFFVSVVLILLATLPKLSIQLRAMLIVMGLLTIITVGYSYVETSRLNS